MDFFAPTAEAFHLLLSGDAALWRIIFTSLACSIASTCRRRSSRSGKARAVRDLSVVIPVYNEEHSLPVSVPKVLAFFDAHPEHRWRIVVADNASIDRTLEGARGLETAHPGRVAVLFIPVKGRGIALRTAWLTSDADVVAYMDVDLSTDLAHLPALVDPIARGEVDVAYGTRLHRESRTNQIGRAHV